MEANETMNNVLKPEESTYQNFITWCEKQNIETYSESVFLVYFSEIAKSQNVSALWKTYSLLKTTFIEKHNLNITEYQKLTLFIQKQNTSYSTPKVHSTFTNKQIFQFLEEAPDDKYLLWKICLMFGVAGACMPSELKNIMTYHIEDTDDMLVITVADAKAEKTRTFLITDKMFTNKNIHSLCLYRKYLSLRPLHITHDFFFIFYTNNKCTTHPVGIQNMESIPYNIASYLKIEDANKYNKHSFYNTSASLLRDSNSGSIEECLLAESFDDCVDSSKIIDQEAYKITDDNNAKSLTLNNYEKQYQNFMTWHKSQNEETYSEDVFLTYFYDKAKSGKRVWPAYKMLKSTFLAKHKINLCKYQRLLALINQERMNYIPKVSKLFTREEVCEFLEKAPDDKYLLMKVCLIFGIAGACTVEKLKNIMIYHIEDKDTVLIIQILDTKSGNSRTFTVSEKMFNNTIKPIDIYRRYSSLRPTNVPHENFFIYYANNKCSPRVVGVNNIAKFPYKIASYLQIKDAKKYFGPALGKISGSLFADNEYIEKDYIDSPETVKQDTLINTTENGDDAEDYIDSSETIQQNTSINTTENAIDCAIYIEFPVIVPQTPLYIIPKVDEITNDKNTMPKVLKSKTQNIYDKRYKYFTTWCKSNNIDETYSENAFLTYFEEKAISQKRSSLWRTYLILKSTVIAKHNIDISKYTKLTSFIKQQSEGCKPKKSNVFTREHVCNFLKKAPDDKYLLWKVCLIFGIAGACRTRELKDMMTHHIIDENTVLTIKISDGETGKSRSFFIMEKMFNNIKPIDLYRKYLSLRPAHIRHDNFFIFYSNNRCTTQPVGVHTIGKIPTKIASYLKLPDANNYTGHAFRRSSPFLLPERASGIETNLDAEDTEDYSDPELIKQEPLDTTSDAEIDFESPVISKHETFNTISNAEIDIGPTVISKQETFNTTSDDEIDIGPTVISKYETLNTPDAEIDIEPTVISKQETFNTTSDAEIDIEPTVTSKQETFNTTSDDEIDIGPTVISKHETLNTSDAEIDIEPTVISKHETLNSTEELNGITDDNNAMSNLLSLKSQIDYDRKYQHFITWCKNQNVKTYSENVFLSYFKEKTNSLTPPTLWNTYTVLKSSFIAKHNIDLSTYTRLASFLKKRSVDYGPKQISAFTRDQVCEFLEEAPDCKYLMWKVCLIFGIRGACNVAKLKNMMTYHIEDTGSTLIIKIPHEKPKRSRTFIIREKMFKNIKPIDLYRKYLSLRPSHIDHYKFFIYYGDDKCSVKPVGIHTIGRIPNNIASYLKIGDISTYTGQTFRKSSVSLLADSD